ncbi:MAG: HD domain-containing protein [Gammaproteobacteria bacterium]|nr:HD domain-containing protein [Gammaproteobacteria bacterium]
MLKPSIKTITARSLLSAIMLAALIMMIIIAFNLRALSNSIVQSEAEAIAEIIKAGLTSHMKAEIMGKRDYYLREIKTVTGVNQISIVRSNEVTSEFGYGPYEKDMDSVTREVFKSKKPIFIYDDFSINPTIRAVIPYIASSTGVLNCLGCHHVEEGTVLGAVDINLNVTEHRNRAYWVLMVLLFFSVIFSILIIINTFRTIQVYVKDPLERLIKRARDSYVKHRPIDPDKFDSVEFESVAKEFNVFSTDIIANQELLSQMNSSLSELNLEIEDTLRETVFTIGVIEEQRSKETNNHTKRVTEYSRLLAAKLGLSEDEIELVAAASPLHDIGKLGVADEILFKPGKLTKGEFGLMINHTRIGYSMLVHSKRDILKAAAIIAHQHHERWDGEGYPSGLQGEEIHIYGRIVGLADVFDALCSKRAYKDAWSLGKVVEFLKEERGRHFDPHLVDILLENIDEFAAVGVRYSWFEEN